MTVYPTKAHRNVSLGTYLPTQGVKVEKIAIGHSTIVQSNFNN